LQINLKIKDNLRKFSLYKLIKHVKHKFSINLNGQNQTFN